MWKRKREEAFRLKLKITIASLNYVLLFVVCCFCFFFIYSLISLCARYQVAIKAINAHRNITKHNRINHFARYDEYKRKIVVQNENKIKFGSKLVADALAKCSMKENQTRPINLFFNKKKKKRTKRKRKNIYAILLLLLLQNCLYYY